jgi:hypothetical protein
LSGTDDPILLAILAGNLFARNVPTMPFTVRGFYNNNPLALTSATANEVFAKSDRMADRREIQQHLDQRRKNELHDCRILVGNGAV